MSTPPETLEAILTRMAAEPQPNTIASYTGPIGPLRTVLEDAKASSEYGLGGLTVLGTQNDPYRLDTDAGHRDAQWFKEISDRLIAPGQSIHLRGLHYALVASGSEVKPNGVIYRNTDEDWTWLQTKASKAARWLGYVKFDRISDGRNEPAQVYVPEEVKLERFLSPGEMAIIPNLIKSLPSFQCSDFSVQQPFRIIFIGEKSSLSPILLPIAQRVEGELLLPSGEISDTMLAELASRCDTDGRPAVVFYFSDFDPSGRQMPVSVSRKLQALRDLCFPCLEISVHHVALTLEQVREFSLPSTPLKAGERRAESWIAAMGCEQTEIDSLAALRPDVLIRIADEAVAPFYDGKLYRKCYEARRQWLRAAEDLIESHPRYLEAKDTVWHALEDLERANRDFSASQSLAIEQLRGIDVPNLEQPEAKISGDQPEPLFDTNSDFVEATRKLIDHKGLVDV